MRWISVLAGSVLVLGAASAVAQAAPAKTSAAQGVTHITLPPVPKPLLPDSFAGWIADGKPKAIADAAQADPANAEALKEYDFTNGSLASYKRSGETLSLRALRFQDASGAYGAYTFYRQNGWPKEEIGTGAASNHNRVLVLGWQHGGRREFLAPQSHVRCRIARARRAIAGAQWPQSDGSADSRRSAQRFAR